MAYTRNTTEQEFSIRFGQDNHNLLQRVFGAQLTENGIEVDQLARWLSKDYAFHPDFQTTHWFQAIAIGRQGSILVTMPKAPRSRLQGTIDRYIYAATLHVVGVNAIDLQLSLAAHLQLWVDRFMENLQHLYQDNLDTEVEIFFFALIDLLHEKCLSRCQNSLRLTIHQAFEATLRFKAKRLSNEIRQSEQARRRDLEAFKKCMLDNKIGSIETEMEQMISDKERATQTFRYRMGWLTTVLLALAMYGISYVKDWLLEGKK